jgi:hypothetical protein
MKRLAATVALVVLAASAGALEQPGTSSAQPSSFVRSAATGKIRPAVLRATITRDGKTVTITKTLPFLSGGVLASAREALGLPFAAGSAVARAAGGGRLGIAPDSLGCSGRTSNGNVRVNQDCTFRRQAENDIAFNPVDPTNLVGGQNDSRVGWNQTSIQFSTDNGAHWGDNGTAPFRFRLNAPEDLRPTKSDPNRHTIRGNPGDLHSYDACSDPAVAFDSGGRAFYSCIGFDVAANASMLFVTSSPRGAKGSYFDQVPPPFGLNPPQTGREHMVAEDNTIQVFHDKEFITADAYRSSPNRDNVYVTWTVFFAAPRCGEGGEIGFCSSPIYGSMSTDHALTWSTPERISGVSQRLCRLGNALDPRENPHACNFDQGSDPAVLPNGDLVVSFVNGNTPATSENLQILAVHCRPHGSSPAGTARLGCGAPAKVADMVIEGSPRCDFGRGPEQCIPGNFVRAPVDTAQRIAVNERSGDLFVTWFDYRFGEFDIFVSRSRDGGQTWSTAHRVNRDRGTDHYFSAIDVAEVGSESGIGVSYYRTGRVPNENETPPGGFAPGQPGVAKRLSDYVLAGGRELHVPYDFVVVSPRFPAPDGVQAGFIGDYTGLVVNRGTEAHPMWSDTRNRAFAPSVDLVTVDEDAFTITRPLPGQGG